MAPYRTPNTVQQMDVRVVAMLMVAVSVTDDDAGTVMPNHCICGTPSAVTFTGGAERVPDDRVVDPDAMVESYVPLSVSALSWTLPVAQLVIVTVRVDDTVPGSVTDDEVPDTVMQLTGALTVKEAPVTAVPVYDTLLPEEIKPRLDTEPPVMLVGIKVLTVV